MKDAKELYMHGDSKSALQIVEDLLALSPKNTEALRLKSLILDSQGRFDDSLHILQKIANYSQIDDEDAILNLNKRIDEDRDSLIYSRFSEEGRWYFSFSPIQIFIAVFGLAGCVLFLVSSPLYFHKSDAFLFLGLSFFVLVLLPWLTLFILNFKGVKKVLVGLSGLAVYHGFSKTEAKWSDISQSVIEYDHDLNKHHLRLLLYSKESGEVLFDFNISDKKSDVFARRHFVKSVVSYVGNVTYIVRGETLQTQDIEEALSLENNETYSDEN